MNFNTQEEINWYVKSLQKELGSGAQGTTYYDKTGTPIYRTTKSQDLNGDMIIEYFGKTGKVERREEGVVDIAPTVSYKEAFTELRAEPHRRPGEAVFCPF